MDRIDSRQHGDFVKHRGCPSRAHQHKAFDGQERRKPEYRMDALGRPQPIGDEDPPSEFSWTYSASPTPFDGAKRFVTGVKVMEADGSSSVHPITPAKEFGAGDSSSFTMPAKPITRVTTETIDGQKCQRVQAQGALTAQMVWTWYREKVGGVSWDGKRLPEDVRELEHDRVMGWEYMAQRCNEHCRLDFVLPPGVGLRGVEPIGND